MAVYVDDMWRLPMGQFRGMRMSHMIADTEDELHAMADKLGLKREWYQGDHYDVSKGVRGKAIAFGAREITVRQLSAMTMLRRWGHPMGDPETAMERVQEYHSDGFKR
jgi:hypothetical protein